MISRRKFLTLAGTSGLWVAVGPACKGDDKVAPPAVQPKVPQAVDLLESTVEAPPIPSTPSAEISAWLHIAQNDVITYFVPEAEMGQGIHTAVAMVISAEMGGAWEFATAQTAPLNPAVFGRQGTGGSTSTRYGFENFRKAGATARELLLTAGAAKLGVAASACKVADSKVMLKSDESKSVRFGEIAEAAAKITLQAEPKLRGELAIGKETLRLDSFDKVTGRATYSMDVQQPGMLIGKIAHAPSLAGTVVKVQDEKARAIPGVRDVVQTPAGVVVLADHTWAAMAGRTALDIEWKEPHTDLSSTSIDKALKRAVNRGVDAFKTGNVRAAFKKPATVIEAEYRLPYLAHAPMEPLSCTVAIAKDRCDIWTGTQNLTVAASVAAQITGLPKEQVFVHGQFLGGGFGRRSKADFVAEAVEAAKASGKTVKLLWDREDDIRGFQYRPAAMHTMRAAVDPKAGSLLAWEHRIASPSILKQFGPLSNKIDGTSIDGVVKYGVPDMHITYSDVDLPVPTWFWRSVGHSQNCFAIDGFMNEAAKAAGRDPLEFRLSTKLSKMGEDGKREDNPRLRKVLEIVAEKSGWGKTLPEGMARGISACESFGSYVAQVAEVSIGRGGKPKVHKVHCVIDCGRIINPLTIRAQMDSSIAYGLSAALYGDIHFDKGRVVQGNFDTYKVVRMNEMPIVETTIVQSTQPPGGVGEPALPPIAAAVGGALLTLRGKADRVLPLA